MWNRDGAVTFKFDLNIDLEEIPSHRIFLNHMIDMLNELEARKQHEADEFAKKKIARVPRKKKVTVTSVPDKIIGDKHATDDEANE